MTKPLEWISGSNFPGLLTRRNIAYFGKYSHAVPDRKSKHTWQARSAHGLSVAQLEAGGVGGWGLVGGRGDRVGVAASREAYLGTASH